MLNDPRTVPDLHITGEELIEQGRSIMKTTHNLLLTCQDFRKVCLSIPLCKIYPHIFNVKDSIYEFNRMMRNNKYSTVYGMRVIGRNINTLEQLRYNVSKYSTKLQCVYIHICIDEPFDETLSGDDVHYIARLHSRILNEPGEFLLSVTFSDVPWLKRVMLPNAKEVHILHGATNAFNPFTPRQFMDECCNTVMTCFPNVKLLHLHDVSMPDFLQAPQEGSGESPTVHNIPVIIMGYQDGPDVPWDHYIDMVRYDLSKTNPNCELHICKHIRGYTYKKLQRKFQRHVRSVTYYTDSVMRFQKVYRRARNRIDVVIHTFEDMVSEYNEFRPYGRLRMLRDFTAV